MHSFYSYNQLSPSSDLSSLPCWLWSPDRPKKTNHIHKEPVHTEHAHICHLTWTSWCPVWSKYQAGRNQLSVSSAVRWLLPPWYMCWSLSTMGPARLQIRDVCLQSQISQSDPLLSSVANDANLNAWVPACWMNRQSFLPFSVVLQPIRKQMASLWSNSSQPSSVDDLLCTQPVHICGAFNMHHALFTWNSLFQRYFCGYSHSRARWRTQLLNSGHGTHAFCFLLMHKSLTWFKHVCVCVFTHVCLSGHEYVYTCASRGQRCQQYIELELQAVLNCLIWFLGPELGFAVRVVCFVNCWTVPVASECIFEWLREHKTVAKCLRMLSLFLWLLWVIPIVH